MLAKEKLSAGRHQMQLIFDSNIINSTFLTIFID